MAYRTIDVGQGAIRAARQKKAKKALKEHGSWEPAALALGISRSTFARWLRGGTHKVASLDTDA